MTDFFANSAFLGIGTFAVLQITDNPEKSVIISILGVAILLLHKIERHLYNQTVLMVADDEVEEEYPQHPDFPLDLD